MNPARYDSQEVRTSSDDDRADRIYVRTEEIVTEHPSITRCNAEGIAIREIDAADEASRLDY